MSEWTNIWTDDFEDLHNVPIESRGTSYCIIGEHLLHPLCRCKPRVELFECSTYYVHNDPERGSSGLH